ncbi:calcium proton exchanger [Boletus coccyginus]|nr:calcium proton exchanger [Boletus coccyginus]
MLPPLSLSGSSSAVKGQANEQVAHRKKPSFRERATTLIQPPKKVGLPPTAWQSIRAILLASYLNLLLVCVPVSWALNFALPDQHTLIFVCAWSASVCASPSPLTSPVSFLAIVPLAKLLAFATDELSLRVGQTLAGLMNATLGNAVELIISIIALTKCELDIVQASLIGSILSNLLLVLGMCFFAGGLRFSEQGFGLIAAQMNSSLLTISVIAVLLPGAFIMALSESSGFDQTSVEKSILDMSHGVSIILLFIYVSYLFFQLISHKNLYQDDSEEILVSKKYGENQNPFRFRKSRYGKRPAESQHTDTVTSPLPQGNFSGTEVGTDHASRPASDPESADAVATAQPEEETEEPQMSVPVSVVLLVVVTVVVAVTAEFLVDSISGLTETGVISKGFVGVILLPIVGNAAEHLTAVIVSVKDKLTLSLGVAVGSSIQIALFVIPFIVTLAWILDKPLTLLFDPFQSIVLFLSVLTVNYVVQDGKSNWLEGVILICLYLILCVAFWYYPGTEPVLQC